LRSRTIHFHLTLPGEVRIVGVGDGLESRGN